MILTNALIAKSAHISTVAQFSVTAGFNRNYDSSEN